MSIDYFSKVPVPVISLIMSYLPESQICELHHQLSKKINKAITSLLPNDISVKLVTSYSFVLRLSALDEGKAMFGNATKECILDDHLYPIEKTFSNSHYLFKKNPLKERVNEAAKIIYYFAENYVKDNKKDSLDALIMIAQRINQARDALKQLNYIAYNSAIKETVINHGRLKNLSTENYRNGHTLKISSDETMHFHLNVDSLEKDKVVGRLFLGNLNEHITVKFTIQDKKISFSPLELCEYTENDVVRKKKITKFLEKEKLSLTKEFNKSKILQI